VIVSRDEGLRLLLENLLHVLRAEVFHVDDEGTALARVGTPEGVDAVIVDAAWSDFSVAGLHRAAQASRAPLPFVAVLTDDSTLAGVVPAFAAGVDAVLPKPPDPRVFLNTFRSAQRLAGLERRVRALETAPAPSASEPAPTPEGAEERIDPAILPAQLSSDGRPQLVAQMEEAARQVFASFGVDLADLTSKPATGKLLRGDIVGWQGLYLPASRTWYDVLFHFTRPGVEHLCQLMTHRRAHGDDDLIHTVNGLLSTIQAAHHRIFETGGATASAASTTLFCPPLAAPRPDWLDDAGTASHSQFMKLSHLFMVYDFHPSPGATRIKPVAGVEVGDVLNELVAAKGQNRRIPLANRGVVLSQERLEKVAAQIEPNQTLWVIEPSLLTRRLHR
jgi:DNA-binding response OmpR family regulator